jgi:hypothetical protein
VLHEGNTAMVVQLFQQHAMDSLHSSCIGCRVKKTTGSTAMAIIFKGLYTFSRTITEQVSYEHAHIP